MKQYVVDAFTDKVFAGNPAAVCIVDAFPSDALCQAVAGENNLSETAFAKKIGAGKYHLRWFTPGGEIDMCGHATLATSFVLFNFYEPSLSKIEFNAMCGRLSVSRRENLYELDFPPFEYKSVPVTDELISLLGATPVEASLGRDLLCVFDKAETVRNLTPDLDRALALDGLLLNVTAPGDGDFDCVSRSFAPKLKVAEDPVCGSAHCHIVPYWAQRLGKSELLAYQASARGGVIHAKIEGSRVKMAGPAALFSECELHLPK